jgi:hypothetical protein
MVVAHTDNIACIPRRVALALTEHAPLRVLDLPARGLEIWPYLWWHARTHVDAAAGYFRELIITALREKGRVCAGTSLNRIELSRHGRKRSPRQIAIRHMRRPT